MKFTAFFLSTVFAVAMFGLDSNAQVRERVPKAEVDAYVKDYCADKVGDARTKCAEGWAARLNGVAVPVDLFDQQCRDAKKELTKTQSAFYAACSAAGGNSKTQSCEKAGYACEKCAAESDDCPELSDTALRAMDRRDRAQEKEDEYLSGLGYGDADAYSSETFGKVDIYRLNSCAPFAKQTAKTYKEELDQLKKLKNELREEVSDRQQDLVKARNALSDAQTECESELKKMDSDFQLKVKDAMREVEKRNRELQGQQAAIDQQILQLESAKRKREVDYYTQVATIEKICEDEAERELQAYRAERAAKLRAGTQRSQSLSTLLKTATVGRTNEDELRRRSLIRQCHTNNTKLQKPLQLLNNNFAADMLDLNEAIANKRKERESVQQLIEKNSSNFSQDYQDAVTTFTQEKESLIKSCQNKIGECPTNQNVNNVMDFLKAAKAYKKGTQSPQQNLKKCTGLTAAVVAAQQVASFKEEELSQTENQLRDVLETYSDAVSIAGGKPEKDYKADDFFKSYADYMAALEAKEDACRGESTSSSTGGSSSDSSASTTKTTTPSTKSNSTK